jgi:hypothetical protein
MWRRGTVECGFGAPAMSANDPLRAGCSQSLLLGPVGCLPSQPGLWERSLGTGDGYCAPPSERLPRYTSFFKLSVVIFNILLAQPLELTAAIICLPFFPLSRSLPPHSLCLSYILLPLHTFPAFVLRCSPSSLAAIQASLPSLLAPHPSISSLTMLDAKWTGTDIDRREMHMLNLQQVVRVSVSFLSPGPAC